MYREQLEEVLKRSDLRSADRANMRTMFQKLKRGGDLTYQERQNLFAYLNRYGVQTFNLPGK